MEPTTTLELTPSQRDALVASGEGPLRLIDPETRKEYVVLRAELFHRLERLLCDDSEATLEQAYVLADEVFREDWDNPQMAQYDRYEEFKK